jgi:hypothetical protein
MVYHFYKPRLVSFSNNGISGVLGLIKSSAYNAGSLSGDPAETEEDEKYEMQPKPANLYDKVCSTRILRYFVKRKI